jgi:group I intron endonuclease
MNKICGIYKITSPSGGIYIGQSVDVIRRKWEYASLKCSDQPRLYNSLKKYGWKEHVFEILHMCCEDKLNKMEEYYVKYYDTFNTEHGMNLTNGGGHFKHSEETKQKISKARMGITYSNEIIEKIKTTKKSRTYESRAGNYEIYKPNGELFLKFQGSFRNTFKNLGLPYKSFNNAQIFNRKIKKGGYVGWYAIKLI